ncbi:MAG TPA: helix-turn-helix domain-containing protein [Acidimicrobiia bacterium]|nr:helix-turn-helix domain-containing protein [Acidimicrobiia bacterium]
MTRPSDAVTVQAQARALGDPTRHAIFRRLAGATGPLTVAELTDHVGLHHTAVRQHLAKLVAAGLVVEEAERRTTRGRPRLRYAVAPAAAGQWNVPGPYERLAVFLAEALRTGESPEEVGRRAGHRAPATPRAAGPVEAVADEMARQGFEPSLRTRRGAVEVVLGHCPYRAAALANPEAVCALHLGLAQGAAERVGGVEVESLVPRDPRRAGCRLLLRPVPDQVDPSRRREI